MLKKKLFRFNVKPCCKDIEILGEKGSEFLKSHGLSENTVCAQMAILKELISSGKKFGNLKTSENTMTALLIIENDTIIAEISRPVHESSFSQLDELDKTIQWIRGYQDPFEAYTTKGREVADNLNNSDTKEYGLARIAYEAGAIVDFYVSEDNILNLSAVKSINGEIGA
jgi:hypothetical protein